MVSRRGAAGQLHGVALGLGEPREVIGRERAQVKARGAGADLDVPLGLSEAERDRPIRQRARHLDQQATREHDGAGTVDLPLETNL